MAFLWVALSIADGWNSEFSLNEARASRTRGKHIDAQNGVLTTFEERCVRKGMELFRLQRKEMEATLRAGILKTSLECLKYLDK